jgi:hypothetical protein
MRSNLIVWMLLTSGIAFGQSQTREVSMCKTASIRLRAESQGAHRYEWYRNNELVASSSTHELIVSEEGTYNAFGVNDDGCLSLESVKIIVKHHKPTAVDDIATGKKNTPVEIDVLGNDLAVCSALDANSLVITSQPANCEIRNVAGKVVFTPGNGVVGDFSFTYTVRDQTRQVSNVGTVLVQISTDPLPVVLTRFDVSKRESVAELEWATSQEANSDYFEVQRTTDMVHWSEIGRREAARESEDARDYNFTDSLPESGLNYYRLKMIDADNTFAYSRVRSVHFPEFSWAEVFPNPVDDILQIVVRNKRVKNFRIISNSGIVRVSRPVTDPTFTVSMRQYPTGMYYVHFEQDNGAVKIYKLMHN